MADWSQLPRDVLYQIAKRLERPFYQLRFRSVCSSWRSSFNPKPLRLPCRLPVFKIRHWDPEFHVSKRTIFLLSPSSSPRTQTSPISSSWLVKIETHLPNQIRLLDPLTSFPLKPLPSNFPKIINLNHFAVLELGHEWVVYKDGDPFNSLSDMRNQTLQKVVFMCLDWESCDFAFLGIIIYCCKLAMFKSGDTEWSIIGPAKNWDGYVDAVSFRSEFYAVDKMGRTVRVGLDLGVHIVAEAISEWMPSDDVRNDFDYDKKFLVESGGGLLLVDYYSFGDYASERTVKLKVFELDEVEKRWVDVGSLGDRVLFLGEDCKISVSTEGLSGCKGNCVCFKFFSYNEYPYNMGKGDV